MVSTLMPHPHRRPPDGPVVCVVLDGVGLGAGDVGDAVARARTPVLGRLRGLPSWTSLLAHGTAVGMPSDADMGNSEVGHNALGAGRIVDQGAKLVSMAIADGSIYGPAWHECVAAVKASGEPLHFIGLLSNGNVHSHIDHLIALLGRAALEGVAKVRVHVLLDGRDVPARSALQFVDQLETALAGLNASGRDYRVASGGGRMFVTMDRYESDWKIVERGWNAHVRGEARRFASLREAVQTLYQETGLDDQNLPAFVIADAHGPVGPIRDGAAVILFNFRGDRALELTRAFEEDAFDRFPRGPRPRVVFAGMTQYDGDLKLPTRFLVAPPAIAGTMGELLAQTGVRQLAISETHKFGHVTYFWNGNRTEPFDPARERYVEVPSDGPPLEHRPWMRAAEITDRLIAELRTGKHRFARVNYANGDMVGHTGDRDATIVAVETVDLVLGRLCAAVEALGGVLVVTADHGNADEMYQRDKKGAVQRDKKTGRPVAKTSHTLNPVPFLVHDPARADRYEIDPARADGAGLASVAATCLELLGLRPPAELAPSLLRFR